jgi:hypothetical protein
MNIKPTFAAAAAAAAATAAGSQLCQHLLHRCLEEVHAGMAGMLHCGRLLLAVLLLLLGDLKPSCCVL